MKNIAEKNFKSALKFVYSENNTLSIIFQKNEILLGVVGEFNNNIKQLEEITNTNIYTRGNSILVKSNEKKTIEVLVENKINGQRNLFGRNKYMNSVIIQDDEEHLGKLVNVKIDRSNQNSLFGKIEKNNIRAA